MPSASADLPVRAPLPALGDSRQGSPQVRTVDVRLLAADRHVGVRRGSGCAAGRLRGWPRPSRARRRCRDPLPRRLEAAFSSRPPARSGRSAPNGLADPLRASFRSAFSASPSATRARRRSSSSRQRRRSRVLALVGGGSSQEVRLLAEPLQPDAHAHRPRRPPPREAADHERPDRAPRAAIPLAARSDGRGRRGRARRTPRRPGGRALGGREDERPATPRRMSARPRIAGGQRGEVRALLVVQLARRGRQRLVRTAMRAAPGAYASSQAPAAAPLVEDLGARARSAASPSRPSRARRRRRRDLLEQGEVAERRPIGGRLGGHVGIGLDEAVGEDAVVVGRRSPRTSRPAVAAARRSNSSKRRGIASVPSGSNSMAVFGLGRRKRRRSCSGGMTSAIWPPRRRRPSRSTSCGRRC